MVPRNRGQHIDACGKTSQCKPSPKLMLSYYCSVKVMWVYCGATTIPGSYYEATANTAYRKKLLRGSCTRGDGGLHSRDGALLEGVGGGYSEAGPVVVERHGRNARRVRTGLPQPLLVLPVPDVHHLQARARQARQDTFTRPVKHVKTCQNKTRESRGRQG